MKILVVDYIAPIGHVGYVSHQIKCLKKLGYDISFFTHRDFYKACKLNDVLLYSFPNWLHCKNDNPIKPVIERIEGIIKLIMLRLFLISNHYDIILFTSYDIMSFWVFRTKTKSFLVNHNNTTDFSSSIKRFLHNKLPSNYIHIALANFISDYLKQYVNNKVVVVPHGMTKIYKRKELSDRTLFGGRFIYIPTSSSCDQKFLQCILDSENLNNYLDKTNTKLVIKSFNIKTENENFVIISSYIDDSLYEEIMSEALAVFAPYSDESFHYRISAVLMECFGSNVPIISTKTKSYESFLDLSNYNYLVDSPESFIDCIKSIDIIQNGKYYTNLDRLEPTIYWKKAFEDE